MMDKPQKKKGIKYKGEVNKCSSTDRYKLGYNKCWDDREAWLPSEQELYDLVLLNLGRLDGKTAKLVKAIHKRLGGGK